MKSWKEVSLQAKGQVMFWMFVALLAAVALFTLWYFGSITITVLARFGFRFG